MCEVDKQVFGFDVEHVVARGEQRQEITFDLNFCEWQGRNFKLTQSINCHVIASPYLAESGPAYLPNVNSNCSLSAVSSCQPFIEFALQ